MNKQSSKKPKKTKGLGAGIIAFGVVFAAYSAIFHPHSVGGYILAAALSGLFGAIVKVMAEGLDLSVKEPVPESLKNMSADTGNPEVDALLTRGRDMITQIRAENKEIHDPSLTAKLDELEQKCAEIFRAVYDKPAKASQIRKFMDYYLPTTLKMVKGYRTLGERNVAGEDTAGAQKRIDDALGVVLKGCQKMLDNLYRDDVLDITTDIDVLEQMLKRDGLTESDLQIAAAQAKQAAEIDRQVTMAQQQKAQQAAQPEAQATPQAASANQVPTMQTTPPAVPVPEPADPSQWQPGKQTDVAQQVQGVAEAAKQHTPQTPVMGTGSFYAQDGGQATAQAPEEK